MTPAELTALEADLRSRTYSKWSSDVQAVEDFEDELATKAADAIADLRRKLDEARDVIRPFATEADAWSEYADAENLIEGWSGGPVSIICVANLRAARRWLEDK